jgi:hypothetical protein
MLMVLEENQATDDYTWTVKAFEDSNPGNWSLQAFAICVSAL